MVSEMEETPMADAKTTRNPYPLGAHPEAGGIRFSFVSKEADCGILLYDLNGGKKIQRIPFLPEDRVGNIYCRLVEGISPEAVSYQFYEGGRTVADEYGRAFTGRAAFGRSQKTSEWKASFLKENFDWEDDRCPRIPYADAYFYCMHVRGFTKHSSSGVVHRGTFAGIMEKIHYLKEIGVTTLELQPAYEFQEAPLGEEVRETALFGAPEDKMDSKRINYWGYRKGFYYAPKAAYAASGDASGEFRELVKALHRNHMELVMQFYFPDTVKRSGILEILRFWVLEYHVDGFRLLGENLPVDLAAADDLLADTKLLYQGFWIDCIYGRNETPDRPHLAEYNDSYLYDMRRFLKGDESMLDCVLRHMRYIPEKAGRIHYLTNYNGFTLADMVMYDHKHNEANGEDNRDGNDYNCSWNCGEEGTARSRRVKDLRLQQMKNAICMLLLTQSTPLIFMGDEFGNSQKGNNNPYCQDNAITWLDWRLVSKNARILEFWKKMMSFRKAHPILHPDKELRVMDYIACGYPDLSYHGQSAWRPRTDGYFRHIGIMLCGKYARVDRDTEDAFIYLAINMHWESHKLALPRLPRGMKWERVLGTSDKGEAFRDGEQQYTEESKSAGLELLQYEEGQQDGGAQQRTTEQQRAAEQQRPAETQKSTGGQEAAELEKEIPPRSISIFISVSEESKPVRRRHRKGSGR